MAVNPNIKKKADDIRNKIYGKEVRESLASGLEEMSSDVIENEGRQSVVEGRQDSVESQWQVVSDEMTDKDVISAPEIIAARDGESNLKARLDKEHQKVTAQLAQTDDELNRRTSKGTINIKELGAIPNDSTFNNAPIIQEALDNYDEIIIDDRYYTSEIIVTRILDIKCFNNAWLYAFSEGNSVLYVKARINIIGRLNIDARKITDYAMEVYGGARSNFENLELKNARVFALRIRGVSHFQYYGILRTIGSGESTLGSYSSINNRRLQYVGDLPKRGDVFCLSFTNSSGRQTIANGTIDSETKIISLSGGLTTNELNEVEESGEVRLISGGGINITQGGDNGNINFGVVTTIANDGVGVVSNGLYGFAAQYIAVEHCKVGFFMNANQGSTVLSAYFEVVPVYVYINTRANLKIVNTIAENNLNFSDSRYIQHVLGSDLLSGFETLVPSNPPILVSPRSPGLNFKSNFTKQTTVYRTRETSDYYGTFTNTMTIDERALSPYREVSNYRVIVSSGKVVEGGYFKMIIPDASDFTFENGLKEIKIPIKSEKTVIEYFPDGSVIRMVVVDMPDTPYWI